MRALTKKHIGNIAVASTPRKAARPTDFGNEHSPEADLGERDAGDDVHPPPPRRWLLGNQFCRRFLSGLVAPGSTGKSALRTRYNASRWQQAADLTGQHVFRAAAGCFSVSLEDDEEEMRRRILAASASPQ